MLAALPFSLCVLGDDPFLAANMQGVDSEAQGWLEGLRHGRGCCQSAGKPVDGMQHC